MESLITYLKRFKSLEKRIFKIVFDRDETKEEIIRLVTIEQLFEQGIDEDGDSLGEYAPATIEGTSNFAGKIEKGQRYDHITLNDTGDFYESVTVTVDKDSFTIDADSKKEDTDLFDEFGDGVIGLTDESLEGLNLFIRDVLIEVLTDLQNGKY